MCPTQTYSAQVTGTQHLTKSGPDSTTKVREMRARPFRPELPLVGMRLSRAFNPRTSKSIEQLSTRRARDHINHVNVRVGSYQIRQCCINYVNINCINQCTVKMCALDNISGAALACGARRADAERAQLARPLRAARGRGGGPRRRQGARSSIPGHAQGAASTVPAGRARAATDRPPDRRPARQMTLRIRVIIRLGRI